MTTDQKIDEVLKIVREQGDRHELRFAQIDARFVEMEARFVGLNGKLDQFYEALSQDISVFAEDLHQVKRRVTRLEKKLPS